MSVLAAPWRKLVPGRAHWLLPPACALVAFAVTQFFAGREPEARAPSATEPPRQKLDRSRSLSPGRSPARVTAAHPAASQPAPSQEPAPSADPEIVPPSKRDRLRPVFAADEVEQALFTLLVEQRGSEPWWQALQKLRDRPDVALGAIESSLGRLPDPTTGTGPAHEVLLRIASEDLGLDPATRLGLLKNELLGSEDDDGRPHRPIAAFALLLASEPLEDAEKLLEQALKTHRDDAALRRELELEFSAAYPERARELADRGFFD